MIRHLVHISDAPGGDWSLFVTDRNERKVRAYADAEYDTVRGLHDYLQHKGSPLPMHITGPG